MEKENSTRKNYNQSALMSAYNYGKWYGKKSGQFDSKRVDRAFGYLMSGEAQDKWEEYRTTTQSCTCKDWQFNTLYCKHRIAKMIDVKHDQIMQAEIWQYQKAA